MSVLNYQSPASANGQYYYSVLPAASSSSSRVPATARPSCSKYHRPKHRHQDACHRQHLLPVALTLPPLPASNTLRCYSVQPSRSSCSPTPPLVGNSINGGSPLLRDDHEPVLPIHRSADRDAVVDINAQLGRRRHVLMSRSAVLGTTSVTVRGICSNHLPDHLIQLDGGGGNYEETEHSVKLPAEPAATRSYYHLSRRTHITGDEEVLKRKASSASGAGGADNNIDEELGPLITSGSGTLGFVVRSLMDDDGEYRYLRQLTSQEYYHTAGSHHDRPQRQHQQLLLSPDHHDDQEPAPGRVVLTLAVSVASAVKLQSKQMDQIAKKMRKLTGFEHLRMENTVDPSLIAGFVIRYGEDDAHHVIDLSVKGRLAEMEARLQSSDQTAGAASFPGMH